MIILRLFYPLLYVSTLISQDCHDSSLIIIIYREYNNFPISTPHSTFRHWMKVYIGVLHIRIKNQLIHDEFLIFKSVQSLLSKGFGPFFSRYDLVIVSRWNLFLYGYHFLRQSNDFPVSIVTYQSVSLCAIGKFSCRGSLFTSRSLMKILNNAAQFTKPHLKQLPPKY